MFGTAEWWCSCCRGQTPGTHFRAALLLIAASSKKLLELRSSRVSSTAVLGGGKDVVSLLDTPFLHTELGAASLGVTHTTFLSFRPPALDSLPPDARRGDLGVEQYSGRGPQGDPPTLVRIPISPTTTEQRCRRQFATKCWT